MAQRTVFTDDLDGSANAETVGFGYDGANYTIDLSKRNRAAFERVLRPYLRAATKVSGRRSAAGAGRNSRKSRARRSGSVDLAAVRAWAQEQGIEVSSRGRVAQHVIDSYTADN